MPHRTTYFFPRQFPDRGLDPGSCKQLLDHEQINKKVASTTCASATTKETFYTERDRKWLKDASFTVAKKDVSAEPSDLFTRDDKLQYAKSSKQQQFAAFCDWLVERKGERSGHVNKSSSSSSLSRLSCVDDGDDRELLLPKDAAAAAEPVKDHHGIDRNFDRQVSLPRLSSVGSSYAGSLFSGTTTFDGNLSCDNIVKASTTTTTTRQEEEAVERKASLAQRVRESHYLQLTFARRLSSQASLACESLFMVESTGPVDSDPETVSYRLWVLV
jgi:hypothetical protein